VNVQEETRKINNIMSTKRKCVSKMHSFLLSQSAGGNRTQQCVGCPNLTTRIMKLRYLDEKQQ
jgi:hypothetical protein